MQCRRFSEVFGKSRNSRLGIPEGRHLAIMTFDDIFRVMEEVRGRGGGGGRIRPRRQKDITGLVANFNTNLKFPCYLETFDKFYFSLLLTTNGD